MNHRRFFATVLSTTLLASTLLVSSGSASAHDGEQHQPSTADQHSRAGAGHDLAALRRELSPYADVQRALADGFFPVSECTESPDGGMGVHFLNPARAMSPVDATKPAILLYSPTPGGGYSLIGAEWFQADADQNLATDGDRPSLWGRPFDGPMPGHDANMPVHYDLHVWLFAGNPAGVFAPWNPAVSC